MLKIFRPSSNKLILLKYSLIKRHPFTTIYLIKSFSEQSILRTYDFIFCVIDLALKTIHRPQTHMGHEVGVNKVLSFTDTLDQSRHFHDSLWTLKPTSTSAVEMAVVNRAKLLPQKQSSVFLRIQSQLLTQHQRPAHGDRTSGYYVMGGFTIVGQRATQSLAHSKHICFEQGRPLHLQCIKVHLRQQLMCCLGPLWFYR